MELNNELSGITIVSLEQAVAAPYCGLYLLMLVQELLR